MATRIKLRRDTAANWLEQNPILAQGETGFETDTRTMKLGDGATRWADLKYAVTGDLKVTDDTIHGDTSVSLSSGIGNRKNWILTTNGNDGSVYKNPTDTYNDGVAYDSLGNAYSIGWYVDVSGTYLQKISPTGEILFNQFYNQYDSYGYGITVDKNDDVIMILGEQDGDVSTDIVLLKISGEDGTIVWQKNINGYGDSDDWATCVETDLNGDIFVVGGMNNGDNDDCYIGKFRGVTGEALWQKKYDIENFDDRGTGVTIDKDGNLGVVGTTSWMSNFISVFKISGSTGDITWESRIGNVIWQNGNLSSGNLNSTSICADSTGDFYFGMSAYESNPESAGLLVKIKGSDGATLWVRRIGWENSDYYGGTGSVTCDDQDNIYISTTIRKYKENYDIDNSYRATQHITKFNKTGSVIWQGWLSAEQNELISDNNYGPWGGQKIRVHGDYILVGGHYEYQNSYSDDSSAWYASPYVAQLNRDGGEFEVSGWSFKISELPVDFVTTYEANNDYTFDPANIINVDITVSNGEVSKVENNEDTNSLIYINRSNVNKVTFTEKTLTLPAGGSVDISREKLGYITAIGSFDGSEGMDGSNGEGDVWLNGNDRDEKGNTYSAGGWYTRWTPWLANNNGWNNWDYDENIPLVFKTDSEGKLLWQAGFALDQYGTDLVDVVYHQDTNTVIVVGNDGGADGNEGFNVSYLDADTGSMKQDITHIRPVDSEGDIWPLSLRVMTDGTPVVGGYVESSFDQFSDVTNGLAGLSGSTNDGRLVILKSVFEIEGKTTEYPDNSGNWYVYPAGSYVSEVNSYGNTDSTPLISYTGQLGSGATFDISISGGVPTVVVNQAGSGYKAGQRISTVGTNLGGTTSDNDLSLFIGAVDGSGGITSINNYQWTTSAAPDATPGFTNVAFVSANGSGLGGWVSYDAKESYTLNDIRIADTNGLFTYGEQYTVYLGQSVTISGQLSSGGITDYTGDATTYYVIETNGYSNFRLSDQVGGEPLSTTGSDGDRLISGVTVTIATPYVFHKTDNGMYYGVGDTFKILGTALGGATPANDLTITVNSVTSAGYMDSGVDTFTITGTPQTTNIKIYAGNADYTATGTYDITHELNNEGFVWTPNWAIQFGSSVSGSYEYVRGIALDSSDNVIAGGYADELNIPDASYGNPQKGFVAKFDGGTGEQLWAVSVDGNEGYSTVWSVATDSDDNVYSAMADTNSNLVVTKLTSAGEFVWQEAFELDNSETFAIEVTPEGDLLIVGRVYNNNFFNNGYHQDNWNLLLLKLDNDGNTLFTRIIWSQNGLRFNNNNNYSNQLTVKGDRFSIAAHSDDPGNENYQGIVIDLPTDGTGVGNYGNFHYEEVELYVRDRNNVNFNYDTNLALVTPITLTTRPHTFLDVPYEGDNAWRNTTVYGNRRYLATPIYKPEGGSINGVAKIVFEDGSEQYTSMQGLPQVEITSVNGGYNDYWVQPEDNGKHIYQQNGQTIYIPSPSRIYLPIGFAFTIITESNNCGVEAENGNDNIYLSGGEGDNNTSWTIPYYSMATLVKVRDGRWMIAGSNLSSGW